ncbi:MAG: NUDIX domain-containing protein [Spirochaetes bacterium]|uniref:NUDIX domain-containing protein n=1 Tax=Candidatus Ornithospirochaeta stercoripullorum TaxID=2840899 RepID=A0A9D9DZA0_9SPIO|nr:NUDIX domain-containing protein [Candidatus Ornithospirochaeta stercoripullorum]
MKIRKYEGAGMILYHRDDNGNISILLEKRFDDHTWAIPGGGYSDKDKILLNTAIRETYEETGLSIRGADHVKTYRLPFFTYAVFSSELDREELPKRNWESEEIRWFPISDLPKGMNIITGIEIRNFLKKDERKCGLRN